MISIRLVAGNLRVQTPFSELEKARAIPQRRWVPGQKVWTCRPSLSNMEYIAHTWPNADWDDASIKEYRRVEQEKLAYARVAAGDVDLTVVEREIGRGLYADPPPWGHQRRALLLGRDLSAFAYILDQGTGKTRIILDDAAHNFRARKINVLLVLNKNSVKTNWVADDQDAVSQWLPKDITVRKAAWFSNGTAAQKRLWGEAISQVRCDGMTVLSINYEALLIEPLFEQLLALCQAARVMIVCDESTMIGRPGSERTQQANKLRAHCSIARICTGTPIIKSPLKAYSQFGFLSENILGFGSYYAFKARYCIMGGYKNKQVLKFVNLDELSKKIASCSYRITKAECMDLPPKVYVKRNVYMTHEQSKKYKEMATVLRTDIEGAEVSAAIKLTQVMRLQQITGGYTRTDEGDDVEIVPPGSNSLIREVVGIMDEAGDQKVLVWAHFRSEIAALVKVLSGEGYRVCEFHGGVSETERLGIRRGFAKGEFDVLVGNQAAGGMGIDEFKIASLVVYYSNSYDTEARVQSEDRTHRGGSEMHSKITYIDLVVPNTVRVKIIATLRANKSLSDEIMRDGIHEWI